MDKNYYEVLGLPPEAGEDEIKRAYFKLVRKYSPEREPEKFQEIREAYENLKAMSQESEAFKGTFILEFPDVRLASQMRDKIQNELRLRNYTVAMKVAEEAIQRFGEGQGFLYLLGIAQHQSGKTGKAVKTFEKLTKLYPDNKEFQRQLAIAYQDRGYGNKAYVAFQKAYDMGCHDYDFLSLFGRCCEDRGDYKKGIALMEALIANLKKKPKEYTEEILDAFFGIFIMSKEVSKKAVKKALGDFWDFLHVRTWDITEYIEEIGQIFLAMSEGALEYQLLDDADLEKIYRELINSTKEVKSSPFEYLWKEMRGMAEKIQIDQDTRLPNYIKEGADILGMEEMDSGILRFEKLDIQLCILEEWPGNRKELEIIQESYPLYYKRLELFIEKLENTKDLGALRQRLQKEYDRYEMFSTSGNYYKLHPERKKGKAVTQWDSELEGTYVRGQRKIGRNEPCPCGSGKKFKNCCGRG